MTSERTIRVLIADDQELIRHGLAIILAQQPDIDVVGQAEDGEVALRLARALRPDVVLMDLKMPRLHGVQATRAITAELPQTQVVVLTTYDSDDLVFDALRAGAQAYVLKDTSSAELLEAVRGVYQGESRLDPGIARKVLEQFRRLPARAAPAAADAQAIEVLTERETEVLALIAQARSNREIGLTLSLSEGTVKNYVSKIMAKLHANDRTEMVLTALRSGIVRL